MADLVPVVSRLREGAGNKGIVEESQQVSRRGGKTWREGSWVDKMSKAV